VFTVFKVASLSIGIVLLGLSVMLYEEEQRKVHEWLEALWVELDDQSKPGSVRLARFFSEVARIADLSLSALFGPRLLSLQTFAVTANLAAISFALLSSVVFLDPEEDAGVLVGIYVSVIVPLALALLPAIVKRRWAVYVSSIPLFFYAFTVTKFAVKDWARGDVAPGFGSVLVSATLLSYLSMLLVIAVERYVLRQTRTHATVRWAALSVLLNIFMILLFIGPVSFWDTTDHIPDRFQNGLAVLPLMILGLMGLNNLFPAAVAACFCFLTICLLLYGAVWHRLARPIYALAKYKVIERPKLLASAGFTLIGLAVGDLKWLGALTNIFGVK
jgi:hypothetical protein